LHICWPSKTVDDDAVPVAFKAAGGLETPVVTVSILLAADKPSFFPIAFTVTVFSIIV
jgi:hypothetical protein